jgi:cbb3-type cytochrome oxidase cytochrome c subunit
VGDAIDYPQLWGTRRIGPDLAREAGVRSDDWQLTHLYNPRLVVRDSVIPAYPYMFNGSASQKQPGLGWQNGYPKDRVSLGNRIA